MRITTKEIYKKQYDYRCANDDGKSGDAFEIAIRSYIANREYYTVKAINKKDMVSKKVHIEIKTACGTVNDTLNADVIIYCPNVVNNIPMEKQGFVFTNEQWLNMLNGVGFSGKGSVIKENKSRNTINIQSFYVSETCRPKASKKLADYIWDCCYNCPTVEEWVQDR